MPPLPRRAVLLGTAGALFAAPRAPWGQGSRFPDRPITLLVPLPPGGTTDAQMRALAEAATRHFGRQVLVENRPPAPAPPSPPPASPACGPTGTP